MGVVTVLVEVRSIVGLGAELIKGDGGEGGGLVDDRCLVGNLVDGLGGVDGSGLNGLTLDNGSDGLVDVVYDVSFTLH